MDPEKNLEVTLLDALRIKEINLLILSFLIREIHNKYILINQNFTAQDISYSYEKWYQGGAILGLLMTGALSDLILKKKRFLLLLILNLSLFFWDIYLFVYEFDPSSETTSIIFTVLLGMFITGNDLLYLILIPMTIAR